MKITIYELLGKVKENKDTDIYVKYMNRMTEKEDTMWSCVENIIDKLDNKVIYLNDEVEILDEEEFEDIKPLEQIVMKKVFYKDANDLAKDVSILFEKIDDIVISINYLIKNQKKIIGSDINVGSIGGKE